MPATQTAMLCLFSFLAALVIACAPGAGAITSEPAANELRDRCHEDEAIVWVDTGHDACVALDDMFWTDRGPDWHPDDMHHLRP